MKIEEFKLEEWMNKYEASAKYDLSTTCVAPLSLNELTKICNINLNEIFNRNLDYGDITGSNRLKSAIKSLYESIEIDNITVTHGAIGANQLVFLSILEPNDEVISIVPTYQQHYSIPKSFGCSVKLLFLKEENNWLPDLSELKSKISKRTKLLCLNNPNNPTGAVIPDTMLEEICEIAKKNNIWVLSDEVYRGLNFSGNTYSKSIADIYDKGISIGSMSKTYSLPGLRVGWAVSKSHIINEINHQRQFNTISVSILDEYFSSIAIENKEKISKRNLSIIKNGINILKKWLNKNPDFKCILPQGGTTALIKYPFNMPSKYLCEKLQSETGICLVPGETMEMEGYVRIGLCANDLETALNLFSNTKTEFLQ